MISLKILVAASAIAIFAGASALAQQPAAPAQPGAPAVPAPPPLPYGAPISFEAAKKVMAAAEAEAMKHNLLDVITMAEILRELCTPQRPARRVQWFEALDFA